MKRIATVVVLIVVLVAAGAVSGPNPTIGQDETDARLTALETQVADLTGDVSNLRRRVRALEGAADAEQRTPVTFTGSGNAETTNVFGPGTYRVDGECSTHVMFVYVSNEQTGDSQIPIAIDNVGDNGSNQLIVPDPATLLIEVICDGTWSVSFQ